MLQAIGLALDVVGATALVLGLFAHARMLYPGWVRSADDFAHDAAFGVVGATFLISGFVLQALPYMGVNVNAEAFAVVTWTAVTLVGAGIVAWLAYGLLYIAFRDRERQQRERVPAAPPQLLRGLKFWIRP